MSLIGVIAAAIAIVLGAAFAVRRRRRPSHPYPPGPKGRPLVGNLGQIPKEYPWLTCSRLAKEYGPLTYFNMMGQSVIIIKDQKTAVDLLEKRGTIYSNRRYSVFSMELAGLNTMPILQNYTHRLRFQRKLMHSALGQATVQRDVWPLQEKETRNYLNGLLDQPEAFLEEVPRCLGGTLLKMTYGTVKDGELDFVKMASDLLATFSDATHGYLVDVIPILKHVPDWMPGASFKQKAIKSKEIVARNFNLPFEMVKRLMAVGEAPPSYCTRLLDENEANGGGKEVETLILETAGMMYLGGTDSMTAVIRVFLLVMLLHPEVQQRAQQEIDQVIGNDRLPSLQDREALPYVEAILLECLRWYPVIPSGVPHCLKQDDVYNGYHIPTGSILFPDIWGITRDEGEYPQPEEFNPSRWLDDKNKPLDPRDYLFGYGRRICPGIHVAQASLWIAMASILSTFNIKKRKNSMGEDITPPLEFDAALLSGPKPFVCDLKPRSEKAICLIRESLADAPEL